MEMVEEKTKVSQSFSAEEVEVMKDILVNTGQDKFRGSYPLMASICNKVGNLWHDGVYVPGQKNLTDEV